MREHAPLAVITMGQNGPRIHALLAPVAAQADLRERGIRPGRCRDQARDVLGDDGVVLLSPGAPSFGMYRDYVARGRPFRRTGGFDPDTISTIPDWASPEFASPSRGRSRLRADPWETSSCNPGSSPDSKPSQRLTLSAVLVLSALPATAAMVDKPVDWTIGKDRLSPAAGV
jgi:hypothetical protein